MEFVNCPRCGKLFAQIKSPLCPACEREDELTFQSLKAYIEEHPDCTLGELSEGTGVNPKKILGFIREGRLETSRGMHGDIRCEVCNCSITLGRYCHACTIKLNQNLSEMFYKNPTVDNKRPSMYISQKRDR